MSYKFDEAKDAVLQSVVSKIMQKMPAKTAPLCAEFVRQFFGTIAPDDLMNWNVDDLYGAAVSFWSFIENRQPHEAKIHIYNPDFERHGWQTTHTVIKVVVDDMPFLVASLRVLLNRMGLTTHLIVHMGGLCLSRDKDGNIVSITPRKDAEKKCNEDQVDAPVLILIDRMSEPKKLEELQEEITRILQDNRAVVEDWALMRERITTSIEELSTIKANVAKAEVEETKAFLKWIEDHHFTFLGIRDYKLNQKGSDIVLEAIPDTGLGVLRSHLSGGSSRSISMATPEAQELTNPSRILVMSKTNTLASVHRDAYTDYIGIKRFNDKGEVVGERRIIGLYTSVAYNTNPKHIPFLRHKVSQIMRDSNLNPRGHAGKVLLNILETMPRDDLIQGSEAELLDIAMGIYYLQERRRIRMFARMDIYRRFVSCLVYVPKDRFKTELRQAMQNVLADTFHAQHITFSTHFSESVLARIHFIIRLQPNDNRVYDFADIERKLVEVGRSWADELEHHLVEVFGEEQGNALIVKYRHAFPGAYCDTFTPRTAVNDIKHIEALSSEHKLEMNFYQPVDEAQNHYRFKIYQHDSTNALSDVLPILERMGLRVISERPYVLKFEDGRKTWVNEFALEYHHPYAFMLDDIRETFQSAFRHVWFGDAENDGFNQLVLAANLTWREVVVLRTYAKYFKQIGLTFSQDYIERTLINHVSIAKKIVALFEYRFSPTIDGDRETFSHDLIAEILTDLDSVSNLDEDKILRQYVEAISSTLRTNFYQKNKDGKHKAYLSIKLNSKTIPGMPKPYPMFEIFVYSPRVEGVHLRGAKVARGGLRWSDRPEDFRTEILGLMKAQQVKNAVIVPSGAKGGFYPKMISPKATREEVMAEGVACYQMFIKGLLDITDNLQKGKVVKPESVVCHDEDDPYLVVAADKGTATFSDIANAISLDYGFWLGDAFASGGSVGYDHKKMGITAKGAWESVKRHFRGLDKDIQSEDFTVVGIGDMAGDVFGNGMLLSKHILLVAAFNHMHIFVDPNPDAAKSYAERERLFNLPRSTWKDYNAELISKGGGVFDRSAKSIAVSPEMKARFGITQSTVEPNELIRHLLKAQVDLLWSGGIGTFVRAESESNAEVGDRANDAIRVMGKALRCKVVGEGGNLGMTQLGRVEYALNGGLVYTDFIDNSAGVNCSDKEVNIKILLNGIVMSGDLTEKQRNQLLAEMTDDVAKLVLRDNYLTTQSINLTANIAPRYLDLHERYINELERIGKLDRALEFLPTEATIALRRAEGKGLTAPEIAVLVCYSKTILKEQILASDVTEDPYLHGYLTRCFPRALQERFAPNMMHHPLRREILATKLSNMVVNEMGPTFVYRLQEETRSSASEIVKAYLISRSILNMDDVWSGIEALDGKVPGGAQTDMMMLYVRLLRRVTRWFLRNARMNLDITKAVNDYGQGMVELKKSLPKAYGEHEKGIYDKLYEHYKALGVSDVLAHELTITRGLFAATDIIQVAHERNLKVSIAAEVYFHIGDFLDLSWIRGQVIAHPAVNQWEVLSREALRDDLDWQQRQLTAGIIGHSQQTKDFLSTFNYWRHHYQSLIDRWNAMQNELKATPELTYAIFFVAIRELTDLTHSTSHIETLRMESKAVTA